MIAGLPSKSESLNRSGIQGVRLPDNDDDDGGAAERTVIWTGEAHVEASYGNLLLGPKTHEAPRIVVAPVIDGAISPAEYGNSQEINVTPTSGMYDMASGDDDFTSSDHQFTAWVVHDDEAIYVAVEVIDDNVATDSAAAGSEDGTTWQDDGVELFFDADDSNFGGNPLGQAGQLLDGQYVMTGNGARRDAEASHPTFGIDANWFASSQMTGGGYAVEFLIKKTSLPLPLGEVPLGFSIVINDDDGVTGGNREGQLMWSGRAHAEFTYGNLILSDRVAGDLLGLRFTSIVYDPDSNQATVVWASRENQRYRLERSTDLVEWDELDDGYPSGGESTSYLDTTIPADTPRLYYRAMEN